MDTVDLDSFEKNGVNVFSFENNLFFWGEVSKLDSKQIESAKKNKQQLLSNDDRSEIVCPLNDFQRSILFDEIFSGDLSSNSVFCVINEHIEHRRVSELKDICSKIYHQFPIVSSKVIESNAEFFFSIDKVIDCTDLVIHDEGNFSDYQTFIKKYSKFEHSLFKGRLLKFVLGTINGKAVLGIWLHHIVADNKFQIKLMSTILNAINGNEITGMLSDFSFVQHNWVINRQRDIYKEQATSFWSSVRDRRNNRSDRPIIKAACSKVESVKLVVDEKICKKLLTRCNEKNIGTLAFFASVSSFALKSILSLKKCVFLSTFSHRLPAFGADSSGFYTNLAPLIINVSPEKLDWTFVKKTNDNISNVAKHSLLAKENIFDILGMKSNDICAYINYIEQSVDSKVKTVFNNIVRSNHRTSRTDLTFTIIEYQAESIVVEIKGKYSIQVLNNLLDRVEYHLGRLML